MLHKLGRIGSFAMLAITIVFLACEDAPTTPVASSPTAPSGLTAQAADDQRIDLTWVNTGDATSGYAVERRTGQAGGFEEIAQLNSESTTSYADVDLTAQSEFCYRVNAIGSGGVSDYSNVSCAMTQETAGQGPAPEFDATIPVIPPSLGPQPTIQAFSAPGVPVEFNENIGAVNATAVGVWNLYRLCPLDATYVDCRDNDFYPTHNAFKAKLAASGGTSTNCDNIAATPVGPGGQEVPPDEAVAYTWAVYCVTFHNISIEGGIGMRHDRVWRNVTSRLLGPGTAYSITYRWTEGVSTSNGFEFTTTTSNKSMTEDNWEGCVGGSVKASAGADVLGVSVSVEAEAHTEGCFGGKAAQETSQSLTNTLSGSHTISSEQGGEETTSVSGADGANRVYTVWQLVDQYSYVSAVSHSVFTADSVKIAAAAEYSAIADSFVAFPSWRQIDVIWPTPLHQNTQLFAQQTTDWPIGSGSMVAPDPGHIRYFERTAGF